MPILCRRLCSSSLSSRLYTVARSVYVFLQYDRASLHIIILLTNLYSLMPLTEAAHSPDGVKDGFSVTHVYSLANGNILPHIDTVSDRSLFMKMISLTMPLTSSNKKSHHSSVKLFILCVSLSCTLTSVKVVQQIFERINVKNALSDSGSFAESALFITSHS